MLNPQDDAGPRYVCHHRMCHDSKETHPVHPTTESKPHRRKHVPQPSIPALIWYCHTMDPQKVSIEWMNQEVHIQIDGQQLHRSRLKNLRCLVCGLGFLRCFSLGIQGYEKAAEQILNLISTHF